MGCVTCGFRKKHYYICSKCSGPVCHQCIMEGLCMDCFMETHAKVKNIQEEYEEKIYGVLT